MKVIKAISLLLYFGFFANSIFASLFLDIQTEHETLLEGQKIQPKLTELRTQEATTAFLKKLQTERFILISAVGGYVRGTSNDGEIMEQITSQKVQWTAEHEWILVYNKDGTYAFKNLKHGTYLKGDGTNLVLSSSSVGNYESWDITILSGERVCIKSRHFQQYLTSGKSGQGMKIYPKTCSYNEIFLISVVSNEAKIRTLEGLSLTFQSLQSNYLSARIEVEQSSYSPLKIMNELGFGEKFQIQMNQDGTYSLKTYQSNYIVGAARANATIKQTYWNTQQQDQFDFVYLGSDHYCIRSRQYGNFLSSRYFSQVAQVTTQEQCGDDEIWTLGEISNVSFVEITYKLDQANITQLAPLTISNQTLINNASYNENIAFEFFREVTHANTFEHKAGYVVGPESNVEAKIPFIGSDGKVIVSGESSSGWKYGGENIIKSIFKSSSSLLIVGGGYLDGSAILNLSQLDIPYTGIVHFFDTDVTQELSGIYHGINCGQLKLQVDGPAFLDSRI